MTNVTISGNTALDDGGGLLLESGSAGLFNVTITNDTADNDKNNVGVGGGVF